MNQYLHNLFTAINVHYCCYSEMEINALVFVFIHKIHSRESTSYRLIALRHCECEMCPISIRCVSYSSSECVSVYGTNIDVLRAEKHVKNLLN